MSEICLQFGQCGNQLGCKVIDTLYKYNKEREQWFHFTEKGEIARCILVDSETKVVPSLLQEKKWNYLKENVVITSGGSGNNWALGYYVNGPLLADKVLERVRLECEKSDYVRSIIAFLSAGGGTGSGAGTYIIEKIQDAFPNKYVIGNVVFPFVNGASPVHLYNTVLSLSRLNDSCDAVITFYNDFIFKQCSQLYKDGEFKFAEMNNIISKQLCSLFNVYNGSSFTPNRLQKMIPLSKFKLLSLKSCPYTKENVCTFETPVQWKALIERLMSMLVKNSDNFWDHQNVARKFSASKQKSSNYYKAIANIVMCNGRGASNASQFANASFQNDSLYCKWNLESERFTYLHNNTQLYELPQFSTLLTNSGVFINRLDKIVEKAWSSFMRNAYCHHFEKYGVDKRDFSVGFLKVENIIDQYNSL